VVRDAGRTTWSGAVAPFATAVAVAAVAATVALLPVREERLLVGRPGDGQRTGGMSLPSAHLGEPGRWTRGDGELRAPEVGLPAVVSLRMAAPDERVPDSIEIVVDGYDTRRVTLAGGWNLVDVALDRAELRHFPDANDARRHERTLRVRSLTTGADAAARGVFIERAVLTTGGTAALTATPIVTWAGLVCAALGVIAFGWVGGVGAGAARPWLASVTATGLACLGAVAFRTGVVGHLGGVVAGCWVVALVAWLASRPVAATCAAWPTRRVTVVFALAALGSVALLLPDVFVAGRVLSQADQLFEYYPWRTHAPAGFQPYDRPPLYDVVALVYPFSALTQASVWAGAIPVWTSGMAAGQPFLGTFQSALLSPFTWLLAVVPLPHATVVIAVARLLVAGVGMFAFLRATGLSRWASAFGGLAFLLNPFSVVWLEHPLAGVPPWLPWTLLAGERLSARGPAAHAGGAALLAGTTALVLAGGHPHTGMFTAALGAAYALVRAWRSGARWRAVAAGAGALALGVGLVAVQVVPFLEYLSLSRAAAVRESYPLNPFFAPASTLITTLVPNFLGQHGGGNFAGPTNYLEQQAYPGIAVWLLAAVGAVGAVVGRREWRTWFFTAAALIAFLVMYAAPGVHQAISALPLIKAASLPRVAGAGLAALAVLAAIGADRVLGRSASQDRALATPVDRATRTLTIAVVVAALVLITAVIVSLRGRAPFLHEKALWDVAVRWSGVTVWLAAVTVWLVVARLHDALTRSAAAVGLCGVLVLDLLFVGRGFHDTVPPSQVFPEVPEIAVARQDRGVFRVLGLGQALLPNAALVYGLQDVRGYDGIGVARYADLLDVVLRVDGFNHIATGISSPLIDLLNVKYVFSTPTIKPPEGWFTRLTDGEAPLYVNNRVFPRAFLVDGYVVRDGNAARRTLRDGLVDFRRLVLLEQDPPAADRPVAAASGDQVGAAAITEYADHHVRIRTDAPGARLLVLTDVHYPGWRAFIDGVEAPIHRANFAFRAVPVPGGRHEVVFEYRPASVRIGLAVSAASALVVALLLVVGRRPRHERS
jgi:hypothetical protein